MVTLIFNNEFNYFSIPTESIDITTFFSNLDSFPTTLASDRSDTGLILYDFTSGSLITSQWNLATSGIFSQPARWSNNITLRYTGCYILRTIQSSLTLRNVTDSDIDESTSFTIGASPLYAYQYLGYWGPNNRSIINAFNTIPKPTKLEDGRIDTGMILYDFTSGTLVTSQWNLATSGIFGQPARWSNGSITLQKTGGYILRIPSDLGEFNIQWTPPTTSTDLPIEQRRLPVPEDLSNSVIFSTNFYSATDLSNGEVPPNLFNSYNNTDISFTTARDFWLTEISNNDYFTDPSNSGITIITIQNLTSDHTIGAHTLQFLNWDISSNKNFGENASNNERMFTGDGSNNLANTMQFISGIRTLPISGDTVNLPLAIVNSNNTYNSFSTISGDSLNDLSNQFLNYMIVLGRPILVNIANLYDNISLTNIVNNKVNDSSTNLINWRSSSPYGSSANNVWIKDNKLYDSESNGNELPFPLILVPGVTYNITNISEINIEFTLDIQDHFIINGIIPINLKIELQVLVTHTKRVTTNKQMNSNFELTDLTTL